MPSPTAPSVSTFEDPSALMHAAAEKVIAVATEALAARRRFTWALSGGSTPRRLFSLLSAVPYAGRIDWDRVHFFWGDERCVPPDHPESNYRLANETLLSAIHPPSGNVHRMPGEVEPAAGAARYEALLRRAFFDTFGAVTEGGLPRFDLVLLGMGTDGHTASLFPGTPAAAEVHRWVVPTRVEQAVPHRLTLTFPVINAAAHVMFVVSGADKADRVREVLAQQRAVDIEPSLPAARIRPVSGELAWLLDAKAAGRLHG